MTDETTSEQLAEIDGQPQPIQVREGRWRTRGGDIRNVTPTPEGDGRKERYPWWDAQWYGSWTADGRYHFGAEGPLDLVEYLGPIEEQPEPQPQPVPQPESDAELRIRLLREANDSQVETIARLQSAIDERAKLGGADQTRIELQGRIRELETIRDTQAATIHELRSEVSYVQNLLGTERRRVTQLEELVASLRTINEAQEKAFEAAGQDNTALRNQLEAVKAEAVQERLERNRWHNQVLRVTAELNDKTTQCEILQIELDAAQQVPADSPELRQLRADLEEVTRERDQHLDSYQRIFGDLETIRETTKAAAVEAIAEWLQAFRGCNSPALALLLLEALPHIMRSVTGLEDEDIE